MHVGLWKRLPTRTAPAFSEEQGQKRRDGLPDAWRLPQCWLRELNLIYRDALVSVQICLRFFTGKR